MAAKKKSARPPVDAGGMNGPLDSHRLFFETSPQGIVIAGSDGEMIEANPAALRILGLSREQILGMTNFDPHWRTVREDGSVFPPDEHPMTRALRLGKPVGPEVMGVRVGPGDDTRWLDVSAMPLFRPGESKPAQVMATFVDNTERKEIELRLRASQGLLERAELVAQLGHFQVDLVAGVVEASAGAARIYGLEGNSWPYLMVKALVLTEDRGPLDASIAAMIAGGGPMDTEYRIHRQSDGAERHLHVMATYDAAKRTMFGVMTDDTARKQAEAALIRQSGLVRSIFDADDAHMAVVGPDGTILDINAAWRRFALLNGARDERSWGVGSNYFGVCAPEYADETALSAADGIRRVQAGFAPSFSLAYPCHSPSEQRWFTLTVLPIEGRPGTVLVAHRNETMRLGAESALRESESRYRMLSENSADVIWLLDLKTDRFEYVSPSCLRLRGFTPDEVMKQGLADTMPPDSMARVEALLAQRLPLVRDDDPETRTFVDEIDQLHRDGTIVPTEVVTRLLPADDGSYTKILGVTREISERRKAEERLRRSEQRFQTVFRASPVMMTITEMESGRYLDVNDRFCEVSGFSRLDAIGHSATELGWIAPGTREAAIEALRRTGELLNREEKVTTRAGEELTCLMSGEVLELNGVSCLLSIVVDVTDAKRVEARRAVLEEQVQHLKRMDSVGRLAGGVAHDLNNVLTAVLTLSELQLADAPPGSALQEDLEAVVQASLRGQSTVRGLLDFSRAAVSTVEPLDLNGLIRDEVSLLSRTTLQKARLNTDLEEGLPLVRGDRAALTHVFMNLCLNAVDAMPHGGSLTVRTRRDGDAHVVAQVIDSGEGMPPEVRARALDPFFTTKPQGQGTGLGLSIVFGTVKAHGGTIDIQSEPGEGTTVTIRLPATGPLGAFE